MEDVKIMENMKEVLKKARRAKHKKPRSQGDVNGTEPDDAISEILNEKWMFSSPPMAPKTPTEETSLTKVNAFERMMTKKVEPLAQISPEMNGLKKKRKYVKKPKYKKLGVEILNQFDEPRDENNEDEDVKTEIEPEGLVIRDLINEKLPEDVNPLEKSLPRKRSRVSDTLVSDSANKKKKTKLETLLLDSNENAIVPPVKADPEYEISTPTYQSGRPKRSCAGNINYELLISPDKVDKVRKSPELPQKRSTRSKPSKKADEFEEIHVIEDESPVRPKKLAPLFVKKVPKPAIDPAVKEARRNFLLLGLPEDLRNTIVNQRQFEDEILSNKLIAFPSISHITQLGNEEESGIITESFWQKSLVKINASEDEDDDENHQRPLKRGVLTDCCAGDFVPVICDKIRLAEREPVNDVKELVKAMKEEFCDFPANRCFKQLHKKHRKAMKEPQDSDYCSQGEIDGNFLFVDIFKPQKFDEFHVNVKPVRELQKFLLTWNEKQISTDYDSDETCSQRSSTGLNNFMVLTGYHGSGKTSSVYALANDLNYQVIEINAGSRRSGKIMLQELSEATQSHRVKNKSGKLFSTFDEADENSQESNCGARYGAQTIILIEDAELVFDSDDGFAASLQQLINISKRPVILTTNNRHCQHLQKFIQQNEIMFESPTNSHHIARYLSLLCLAANYQIKAVTIEHLFALNGHDMRRTINEIEFFIRSRSSRTKVDDLMEFYQRPRRVRHQRDQRASLSSICFESSIASSFAAMSIERANDDDVPHHQQHLMLEMAEFFDERCNVVETQRDLALGKQKLIER